MRLAPKRASQAASLGPGSRCSPKPVAPSSTQAAASRKPNASSLALSGWPGSERESTSSSFMPMSLAISLDRLLRLFEARRQRLHDPQPLALRHRTPARDLLKRTPAAGAQPAAGVHGADLDAGRRNHRPHLMLFHPILKMQILLPSGSRK